jgi:hypothetical protein
MSRTLRRILRARSLLAGLALTLLASAASAWGPVGHRAVGAVADNLVSDRTRAAVQVLLQSDVDAAGRPLAHATLAAISTWPDEVRGSAQDHPHWHYDNRPLCGSPTPWCPGGECASSQIVRQLAILGDRQRPIAERRIALKWVVHLAGDLHQPLHAVDYAEGGNRIHLAGEGPRHGHPGHGPHGPETLHAFWDSRLVALELHPEAGEIPRAAMRRLMARTREINEAQRQAPPEAWALESFALARERALAVEGLGCAQVPGHSQHLDVQLSREDIARDREVVAERLALAGVRLAVLLDRALGAE